VKRDDVDVDAKKDNFITPFALACLKGNVR
jgi:hypothetical protein